MRRRLFAVLALLVFGPFLLAGCQSGGRKEDINYFTKPAEIDVTSDSYILHPPDEVEVRASAIPEIHLTRQFIRPDGKVTFEGIGPIHASGRTPQELAEIIRERAMTSYALAGEHPIDVQVRAYRSKIYYVIGHVHMSGPRIFTGRDTLLKALSSSRPMNGAQVRKILVLRPSADEAVRPPRIFELDYNDMIVQGDTSKNVLLEEGDIIYVPPTLLARIGMVIDQLLRPIRDVTTTPHIVQPLPVYPY